MSPGENLVAVQRDKPSNRFQHGAGGVKSFGLLLIPVDVPVQQVLHCTQNYLESDVVFLAFLQAASHSPTGCLANSHGHVVSLSHTYGVFELRGS